ncbi:MAG: glycosyltransferase family 39 protein [Bryobacteraceae bacterium]
MGQRAVLGLSGILLAYFALRVPGLGWGLPPTTPEVRQSDLRCSYAIDEDDVLTAVSFLRPCEGKWDVRLYHWGTLHFLLLAPVMKVFEAVGYLPSPWRDAYYNLAPGDFERVYMAARLVSVLIGAVTVWLAFLLGRQWAGETEGLLAALFLAVSPAHMLTSLQARVDMTMTVFVALTALLALRSPGSFWMAAAAGLAVAAKHSAILQVAPIVLVAGRLRAATAFGFGAGLLAGEPFWLVHGGEIVRQLRVNLGGKGPARAFEFAGNFVDLARFSMGVPLATLAVAGLRWRKEKVLLASIGGGVLVLVLMQVVLLRLHVPLLPFLSVAAAMAVMRMGRAAAPVALIAMAFPLFACLAQLDYMRSPHPANEILPVILKEVPPRTPIARLIAEMPPLDRRVYPMAGNPLLHRVSAPWVLLTDLAVGEYPPLPAGYDLVADRRLSRRFAWATLGEHGAPHDWKYTHPSMMLYRRNR